MKKLFGLLFGLMFLAGCGTSAPTGGAMPTPPPAQKGMMEEPMEKPIMEDDSMMEEDSEEALDAEVESIIDEEAAVDAELDAMEGEF